MEPSQFDEFTKLLATRSGRRQALKTFVATAFGGILALSGIGIGFAKKKCPPGLTNCGGKCVDTTKDPNNCGVCGTVCRSGLCVNGLCCAVGAVQCGTSCCTQTCCGSTCVDTNIDPNNCGGCRIVCTPGQVCQSGKCVVVTCQAEICPNFARCNNNPNCSCFTTTLGQGKCGVGNACGCGISCQPCISDVDCPGGQFCAINTCCGAGGVCLPTCPPGSGAGVQAQVHGLTPMGWM